MTPWRALGVACSGSFVAALSTSLVAVAAPVMARDLDVSPGDASWVLSAYLLTVTCLLALSGSAVALTSQIQNGHAGCDFVTLGGDLLNRHGIYTGGYLNGNGNPKAPASILGRKNQIAELQAQVAEIQEKVAEASRKRGALLSEQTELQASLQQAQTELRDQEVAIATREGEFNALENSRRLLHQKIDTVVYEVTSLAAQEKEGLAPDDAASAVGMERSAYAKGRYVVLLADRTDLATRDQETARAALADMNEHQQVKHAFESVLPLVEQIYGQSKQRQGQGTPERAEAYRLAQFDRAFGALVEACSLAQSLDLPYLPPARASDLVAELDEAARQVRILRDRIKEFVQ